MKKIAILLAALAGFSVLTAFAQQTASSYSITTDFSYTSQYVFRGLQGGLQDVRGDAFTPSVEAAVGNSSRNGYLGVWTMQPLTRYEGTSQNNEIDIYAGYRQKITRTLSIEGLGTYYWYPEAVTIDGITQTKDTYELGARLTYASRGLTASAYGYYDFRLQAITGVGTVGYSFPLTKLGASIDVGFYLGTVGMKNLLPDATGDKIRRSYNYYGFDVVVPYHIRANAIVSAGLHYATNQNMPDGTPANKVWFTLGVTTSF